MSKQLNEVEYTIKLSFQRKSLTSCDGCMFRKVGFQPAEVGRRLREVDHGIGLNI